MLAADEVVVVLVMLGLQGSHVLWMSCNVWYVINVKVVEGRKKEEENRGQTWGMGGCL